jgi:hypothetical protein
MDVTREAAPPGRSGGRASKRRTRACLRFDVRPKVAKKCKFVQIWFRRAAVLPAMEEADEALDAAAQSERDEAFRAEYLAECARLAAETPQHLGPSVGDADEAALPAPVEKPLTRNPPYEGLDGTYWAPSGNYTIIKVPEAGDTLYWADTARRDGRCVGSCMFCYDAFREVDYERGWMVYGNFKMWCADATRCIARMEKIRHIPPSRPAMASSSSEPVVDLWLERIWEKREAELAALPRKRVRIVQRRANRKKQPYTPFPLQPYPQNAEEHAAHEAFCMARRAQDRLNAEEAAAQDNLY